jgi:hypothetical protein
MEYIYGDDRVINFGRYREYLLKIRDRIPDRVFRFASNEDHFNLASRSSLHDAWLEELTICESGVERLDNARSVSIHARLLGAFHDRRIHLKYLGVLKYSIAGVLANPVLGERRPWHGDLITHEVRAIADGQIVHEILFRAGGGLSIECEDLEHREEII